MRISPSTNRGVSAIPAGMRWVAWLLAFGFVAFAACADEDSPATMFAKFGSPDGRFALHAVMDGDALGGIQVIESKSKHVVADLSDDVMLSEPGSLALLWTKDSKCFAANFQAGGRYSTTEFFRWNGKKFAELKSPESQLYDRIIHPAKERELKADGKTADTYLRRIEDTWETVKWIDDSTAEIHGASMSTLLRRRRAE